MTDPAVPVYWGWNQRGMQATRPFDALNQIEARKEWMEARDAAVSSAQTLDALGAHKQNVNRLLEPFMWITVIVSSTAWQNFLTLRQDWTIPPGITDLQTMYNPSFPAQPEIQVAAYLIREALSNSVPVLRMPGEWHLPLVEGVEDLGYLTMDGLSTYDMVKVSAGRCARVSYLTHDGRRDPAEDIRLHDDLVIGRHWSPLEHPAEAAPGGTFGNFTGWKQYRKFFPAESGEAATGPYLIEGNKP